MKLILKYNCLVCISLFPKQLWFKSSRMSLINWLLSQFYNPFGIFIFLSNYSYHFFNSLFSDKNIFQCQFIKHDWEIQVNLINEFQIWKDTLIFFCIIYHFQSINNMCKTCLLSTLSFYISHIFAIKSKMN